MSTTSLVVILCLLFRLVKQEVMAQQSVIRLAMMMLHPSAPAHVNESAVLLHPNYTDPGSAGTTSLQPGWQQGLQYYRDALNKQGFTIVNSSNVEVRFTMEILFFAVALPTDSPAVQLAKMRRWMNDTIAGVYGSIPVIIAPPTPSLNAAPVDELALICEHTQACLLILPITIDPAVYRCTPSSSSSSSSSHAFHEAAHSNDASKSGDDTHLLADPSIREKVRLLQRRLDYLHGLPLPTLPPVLRRRRVRTLQVSSNSTSLPLSLPQDCLDRNRRSGRRRFDYVITTAPPSLQMADNWLSSMRIQGMTKLAIIRCPNWDNQADAAVRAAQTMGVDVVHDQSVSPTYDGTVKDWMHTLGTMYRLHPEIEGLALFIGYSLSEGRICSNIMFALRNLNIYPKAVNFACSCMAVAPFAVPAFATENMARYGYGVEPWHRQARGPDYAARTEPGTSFEVFEATGNADSPAIFWNGFAARFARVANAVVSAQAALAPLLVQKAVELMGLNDPTASDLRQAFSTISAPSHYGRLSLDALGRFADRPYLITQFGTNGTSSLLSPTGSTTPIYPAPTWDERTYSPRFFALVTERVIAALVAVCLALGTGVLRLLVKFRAHPVMLAATPLLCWFICIGSMMILSVPLVWTTMENDGTCMGKVWLICVGCVTVIVPLFMKTRRLKKIFNQSTEKNGYHVVKITTRSLAMVQGAVWAFVVLFLSVWSAALPFESYTVVVDVQRPALNYEACRAYGHSGSEGLDAAAWAVSSIAVVVALILLLATAVVAFQVRHVHSHFNESHQIGMLIYTILILCPVMVGVVLIPWPNHEIAFAARSFSFLLFGMSTIGILFVPKVAAVLVGKTRTMARTVNTGNTVISVRHVSVDSAPLHRKPTPALAAVHPDPLLPGHSMATPVCAETTGATPASAVVKVDTASPSDVKSPNSSGDVLTKSNSSGMVVANLRETDVRVSPMIPEEFLANASALM